MSPLKVVCNVTTFLTTFFKETKKLNCLFFLTTDIGVFQVLFKAFANQVFLSFTSTITAMLFDLRADSKPFILSVKKVTMSIVKFCKK